MSSSPKRVRALRSTISQPRRDEAAGDEVLGARGRVAVRVLRSSGEARARPGARICAPDVRANSCTSGAPPVRRRSLASPPCSPPRRPSRSTGSRRARSGSRSTSTAACRRSRSSACPTPRCARRASGCGRRWSTAASSSRCGGSSPTSRPASLRKAGPGMDLAIADGAARPPPASSTGRRLAPAGDGRRAGAGRLGARRSSGVLAIAEAARELRRRRRSSCRPRTARRRRSRPGSR